MARGAPDFTSRSREKGKETRIYRRSGSLAKNTEEVLCDLAGIDVELQHLEFSSNDLIMNLVIKPYKADGALDLQLFGIDKEGEVRSRLTPYDIHDTEDILWYELIYDTVNSEYKFGLGYPLRFANGVKISLYNTDISDAYDVCCEIIMLVRG